MPRIGSPVKRAAEVRWQRSGAEDQSAVNRQTADDEARGQQSRWKEVEMGQGRWVSIIRPSERLRKSYSVREWDLGYQYVFPGQEGIAKIGKQKEAAFPRFAYALEQSPAEQRQRDA